MTKSKIGQVVSYIAILLVIVAAIGVFAYFTNGFTTDFKTFYVSVNGKDVMTSQNGYVVTPSEPLKVDVKYTFAFNKNETKGYSVNNGMGGGVYVEGASVTITADEPTTGKKFSGWTIVGINGLDTTQKSLTFNMPANAVTATANYEDIEYTITVNGGKADKTKAKYGESVTITANAPVTGKEFDKWVVTGITLSDEDLAKSTVTFEMPASNVTMEAHFRDEGTAPSVEIKVEGGTGGGTYKQGDEVTVTAEDKEGKVFQGWQDETGKIVSTEKSYKFTVSEEKTLTAVYEDKSSGGGEITPPAKKDGLSGGQIAGIVIGSVAVAGIGGFAIFWFAVKKKTFADLIAAIKALFTKKK